MLRVAARRSSWFPACRVHTWQQRVSTPQNSRTDCPPDAAAGPPPPNSRPTSLLACRSTDPPSSPPCPFPWSGSSTQPSPATWCSTTPGSGGGPPCSLCAASASWWVTATACTSNVSHCLALSRWALSQLPASGWTPLLLCWLLCCSWRACVSCNCLLLGEIAVTSQERLRGVLQVSYAAGLCALLLLWGVYPRTFDFGQATAVSRESRLTNPTRYSA